MQQDTMIITILEFVRLYGVAALKDKDLFSNYLKSIK